jgi:lysophospholipase L1-like esterase
MGQGKGSLKIMPMGDSITQGFKVPGGYRQPLYDILTGQGYAVDYLGRFRQKGDPTADDDHWGRPGLGIADTDEIIGGRSYVSLQANEGRKGAVRDGLYEDLFEAISPTYFSRDPNDTNLLLLMAGTNDVVHQVVEKRNGARAAGDRGNDGKGEQQDRIAESGFDRFDAFIERVNQRARAEDLRLEVVVGTIPDISRDWNRNGLRDAISDVMRKEVRQYNKRILDRYEDRSYSHIEVTAVDTFRAVGSSLADGLHPLAAGFTRMAETWAQGIEQALA